MYSVMLAELAADDFKRLARAQRTRALKLMRSLAKDPVQRASMCVRSTLLNTTLYEIRQAGLRVMYEIAGKRAIVLTIQSAYSKSH